MKENPSISDGICEEPVFHRLYLDYAEALFRFLFYKSGDAALAEDLVQEAFLRTWNNCKKVSLEKAKSYLFSVANRLFLDEIKHRKVQQKFRLQANLVSPSIEDGQFLLEQKEFWSQLEKAIADLPENQRLVFLLNRVDKMKYKDIAELLNISVKAVEKRMSLALKHLRQIHKKI